MAWQIGDKQLSIQMMQQSHPFHWYIYWWLSARLQYRQCFSNGDTEPSILYVYDQAENSSHIVVRIKWPTFYTQHFRCILLEENSCIWSQISPVFVTTDLSESKSVLVQVLNRHQAITYASQNLFTGAYTVECPYNVVQYSKILHWAMGCLLWLFVRKLTELYWHCTVCVKLRFV